MWKALLLAELSKHFPSAGFPNRSISERRILPAEVFPLHFLTLLEVPSIINKPALHSCLTSHSLHSHPLRNYLTHCPGNWTSNTLYPSPTPFEVIYVSMINVILSIVHQSSPHFNKQQTQAVGAAQHATSHRVEYYMLQWVHAATMHYIHMLDIKYI